MPGPSPPMSRQRFYLNKNGKRGHNFNPDKSYRDRYLRGQTSLYISRVQINLVSSSEVSLDANVRGAERDKEQVHDDILLPSGINSSPTRQDKLGIKRIRGLSQDSIFIN